MSAILVALYQIIIFPIAVIICKILPKSPFRSFLENPPASAVQWIKVISYFCPVEEFIIITTFWVNAMLLWYIVRWIIGLIHNGSFTDMIEMLTGLKGGGGAAA